MGFSCIMLRHPFSVGLKSPVKRRANLVYIAIVGEAGNEAKYVCHRLKSYGKSCCKFSCSSRLSFTGGLEVVWSITSHRVRMGGRGGR